MRDIGERLNGPRVKFKQGLQRKFLEKVKEKSRLSWSELAEKLNLSTHTLAFDLRNEKSTMSQSILIKLIEEYPIEEFEMIKRYWIKEILDKNWGQRWVGNNNLKKIKYPEKSEDLAELIGVIVGDGHLEKKTLTITGNENEIEHYNYLSKKFNYLFGLNTNIIKLTKQNSVQLKIYSMKLIQFLLKNDLVLGNKIKNGEFLPRWIFEKTEYINGALRGLLDTDGGIYLKQKKYKRAIIEFQTKSSHIRKDIFEMLRKIDLNPSKSATNVRIQDQNEVKIFLSKIGCSNPKNIIRTKYYLENGSIPKKERLKKEIKSLKVVQPFKASLV